MIKRLTIGRVKNNALILTVLSRRLLLQRFNLQIIDQNFTDPKQGQFQ